MDRDERLALYSAAVRGGRYITSQLARVVSGSDRGHYWVDMRSVLSGSGPRYNALADGGVYGSAPLATNDPWATQPEALRHLWNTHIDGRSR